MEQTTSEAKVAPSKKTILLEGLDSPKIEVREPSFHIEQPAVKNVVRMMMIK